MAFLTIEPSMHLSREQLERAIANGPPEVAVDAPHEQLLAAAGFTQIEVIDVTGPFSRTQQAWIDRWHEHEQELADLLGSDVLNERMRERQAMRSAIDDYLLQRTLYVSRAPS